MATSKLTTYSDTLFFLALLKAINEAKESIELMTFVFKSNYGTPNRAQEILDALLAAAARGVRVYVVLNYSQYEPDVCITNYQTGQTLLAGGCRVRLGIKSTTLHSKLIIIDGVQVFAGSHNLTRGGLTFNREFTIASRSVTLAQRAHGYFLQVWEPSPRITEVQPPAGSAGAVTLHLSGVAMAGEEVRLSFTANHVEGVEAFAAVADDDISLAGARMGPGVYPSERTATVLPEQASGATVFLAVRAYREGQVIAESNMLEKVYLPEGAPPGGGEPEPPPPEPPAPEPPTAPNLTSVTQTGDTSVNLQWAFAGVVNFDRFEVHQRDLQGNWHLIGSTYEEATREWSGTPLSMEAALPYRVALYNTAGEHAESNMMYLTGEPPEPPPLSPMTLDLVEQITPADVRVHFTGNTPANLSRYEVQQLVSGDWLLVTDGIEASSRTWEGGPVPIMDVVHPVRLVVFDTLGQSTASNEVPIALMGPPPPPPPVGAPVINSVVQMGPGAVTYYWTWEGSPDFNHFSYERRDLAGNWSQFDASYDGGATQWQSNLWPIEAGMLFRMNAHLNSGQILTSNEVPFVQFAFPPPEAMQLLTVSQVSPTDIALAWMGVTAPEFSRFEIQQMVDGQWSMVSTVTDGQVRNWTCGPVPYMDAAHNIRVVVFNIDGQSAASNEVGIALIP